MATTMTVSKTVAAPPERVFAVASDFANAAQTISAIQSTEILTPGPVGAGTRFRETRVMFGRPATEEMTVGVWDPPRRYTLLADAHGCRYESTLDFRPVDGGTEIAMTFVATPYTLPAKILGFLFKGMTKALARSCAKDLDDLATAIVGGTR